MFSEQQSIVLHKIFAGFINFAEKFFFEVVQYYGYGHTCLWHTDYCGSGLARARLGTDSRRLNQE